MMDHLFIAPDFRSHFLLSVRTLEVAPKVKVGLPEQVEELLK